jgi:hypothetical protein
MKRHTDLSANLGRDKPFDLDSMNGRRPSLQAGLQGLNDSKWLSHRNMVEGTSITEMYTSRCAELRKEGILVRAYSSIFHCNPDQTQP